MLKSVSIIAALVALGIGSANAQQQEAVLQKIEVPSAGFDIVLATAGPGGPTIDLRRQPDPNVVYLIGGELVQPYMGELQRLFAGAGAMMVPACGFEMTRKGSGRQTPVAVYLVPKGEMPLGPALR